MSMQGFLDFSLLDYLLKIYSKKKKQEMEMKALGYQCLVNILMLQQPHTDFF